MGRLERLKVLPVLSLTLVFTVDGAYQPGKA